MKSSGKMDSHKKMAKVENLRDRFENSWQYVLARLERIDLLGTRLPMLAVLYQRWLV